MQELDTVFKAFLELVKIGIGTSDNAFDFSVLTDDDWNEIFKESKKQASALLCFDALKVVKAKPNNDLYNKWFLYVAARLKNNISIIEEQNSLITLLNQNSIPYVILKGTSSSRYYPDSNTRSLGDIDFIVNSNIIEKAKSLLIQNNYLIKKDLSPIHYEFHRGKVRLELHKKISGVPDNKYGDIFSEELISLIDEAVFDDGYMRPSDYHHGIVIFLHTLHHILNNGIGIRHLCDWACFVNATGNASFWNDRLLPLFKSTGTYNFMCGITLTASRLLNTAVPGWCTDVSDDMIDTLTSEIISSGNFGNKKSKKFSLVMTRMDSGKSSVFSKIRGMVRALNKTNHIVCPLIKKVPIIYPFVMIYRMVRYLILMCIGKKPSLIETSKYADERSAIYMKYQLYKVEDGKNE